MATSFDKQCWKCGSSFPSNERHCPDCGADSWNKPQGSAAAAIGSRISTFQASGSGYGANTPQIQQVYAHADTTARTTAAGVWILATLTSVSFWAGVAIIFFDTVVNDPFDTVSGLQYVISLAIAIGLTVGTWSVARGVVE